MLHALNRRDFLGTLSTTALGLALASRVQAKSPAAKPKACILLYMEGGPSHLDTWDPKPGTPHAGPLKSIPSALAGIHLSETLPLMAARMKKVALLRSVWSREGNHDRARYLMHTGHVPQGGVDHPALGAITASLRSPKDLPGYVSILGPGKDAGFLGAAYAPFPVRDPEKPVRNLVPPEALGQERFASRLNMWRALQDDFLKSHAGAVGQGQRAVTEQAISMMQGRAAKVFSLEDEDVKVRDAYGDSQFQQGCLMARRLVEAGIPFVEVTLKGWDTHKENFPTVTRLGADLDRGMAALLDDLEQRGLLASTLVLWMGDFGRSPVINANAGRDHHPGNMSVVMAGGGVKAGQVIGESDESGTAPKERPVTVPDVFRTVEQLLGVDPDQVWTAPSGRPINTLDGGEVIAGLV